MTDEAAFRERIATAPDDDTVRLVFADWLDDRDRPDDAFDQRAVVAARPVIADPDDDAPRLAFADFAEQQGRGAWAGLIRAQITLAGKPDCPDWCDHDPDKCGVERLKKEVGRHLESARRDIWGGPPQFELRIPAGSYGRPAGHWVADVKRGFIETVQATGPAWVRWADHLVERHPIRHAFLERLPEMRSARTDRRDDDVYFLNAPDKYRLRANDVAARARFTGGNWISAMCQLYWPSVVVQSR